VETSTMESGLRVGPMDKEYLENIMYKKVPNKIQKYYLELT